MIYLILFAILSFKPIGFSLAHETRLEVTDVSGQDCPVSLSGFTIARDSGAGTLRYSIDTELSVTNNAPKPILLLVIKVDTRGVSKIDLHTTSERDLFFKSDITQANATDRLELHTGPFGEPQAPVEKSITQESKVLVKVTFVQFADGTTWGEPAAGRSALDERQAIWAELKRLMDIYHAQGEERFVSALKIQSQLSAIQYLQHLYSISSNPNEVLSSIAVMLRNAELHSTSMIGSRQN
jgi:hypothetical protein